MNHLFKYARLLLLGGLATLGILWTFASAPAGQGYKVIDPPQRVTNTSKIEVVEWFWYGCPHCNSLEPKLQEWAKGLGHDVKLLHRPVAAWEKAVPMALLWSTLHNAGVESTYRSKAFSAIHDEGHSPRGGQWVQELLAKANLSGGRRWQAIFSTERVKGPIEKLAQIQRRQRVTAVPALVIEGKYYTSARLAGSQQEMLEVAKRLIQGVRSAQGS